jgi:hypothetical protein
MDDDLDREFVQALRTWLVEVSGNPRPRLPVIRNCGYVDIAHTLELPIYMNFPAEEKEKWLVRAASEETKARW